MSKISYKKLLQMDFNEYSIFIESGINSKFSKDYFNKINKEIRKAYRIEPNKAIDLLETNLQKFTNFEKPYLYAMTLVSITKIHIDNKNTSEIMDFISKTIHYVCENNIYNLGKQIIDYNNEAITRSLQDLKEDEYLQFMKYQIDFYLWFKKFETCIELMCECAFLFSSNNAYQSAYRILNDAQNIALTNNKLALQFKVLITQASICFQERDFKSAKADFDKAYHLSEILGIEIPMELMANMATLLMNTGKCEDALVIMDKILNNTTVSKKNRYSIKMNKSICLRQIGRVEEALELIQEVLNNIKHLNDLNAILEAHLIATKNYLAALNYDMGLQKINKAMEIMDFNLQYKSRLHYRRGFKENYFPRIIPMFLEIASKSKNINYKDITRFLAFTKSNMFSDWLSILDWYDKILEDSSVDVEDKQVLKNVIGKLINFGAPILNGYKEKYDDPFESIDDPVINPNGVLDNNKPWKEFNLITERLTLKYCKNKDPYENSRLSKLQEILDEKIKDSTLVISFYSHDNRLSILAVSKVKCEVIELDKNISVNFFQELYKYQNKFSSFSQFATSLKLTTEGLFNVFDSTISSLISNNIKEILILQEKFFHWMPTIPTLLRNSSLCEYIKNSELVIRTVPIIYKGKIYEKRFNNFLGVLDPAEGLPLFLEELLLSQKFIEGRNEIVNLEDQKINYGNSITKEADVIHLATHGVPISRFTDPSYASLAGKLSKNSLSFDEIQQNFWKLNYSLCINASCDSSDFTNKNNQRIYDTNELIGYSTLFLLNRKSNVISINWPIKDILSYAFSHILYSNLAENYSIERAYTLSLVTLLNLDKDELKNIMSGINDKVIREQKLKLIDNIQSKFPFRDPYCYGAFTMNSLI
ncbi:CHAT domain-containing protein [Fictibacillus nanhaiensis]|uniref:CHAT domain-containing protein n=1 Tax=Fictibacillus nanhaiensis TaxID=742169 RepID=UPI003C22D940